MTGTPPSALVGPYSRSGGIVRKLKEDAKWSQTKTENAMDKLGING